MIQDGLDRFMQLLKRAAQPVQQSVSGKHMRTFGQIYRKQLEYIGANVRENRIKQKLTQEDLANKVGIELKYLRKIEHGAVNPSILVTWCIANNLGIKIDDLLKEIELVKQKRGRPRKI